MHRAASRFHGTANVVTKLVAIILEAPAAATLLVSLSAPSPALAAPDGSPAPDAAWPQSSALTVHIDNDLFGPASTDRDYTSGVSVGSSVWGAGRWWAPDRWLGPLARARATERTLRTLQVSVVLFSPADLGADEPIAGERPYAGLWAISGARLAVAPDGRSARYASLTIGALGLPLTEHVHRAVHSLIDSDQPRGYDHEISDGGEPTARLSYAHRRLAVGGRLGRGGDLWAAWTISAGYLTETSVALAGRWGERGLPWWALGTDLAGYSPAPSFGVVPIGTELSVDGGVRLRARAWNAFLQGQFRHSALRYAPADVEWLIAEAWIGFTHTLVNGFAFRYALRVESAELRAGAGARSHVWGSLLATYSF